MTREIRGIVPRQPMKGAVDDAHNVGNATVNACYRLNVSSLFRTTIWLACKECMPESIATRPKPEPASAPSPMAALERASKIAALCGTVTLSLSVFYDFFFLSSLGLTFAEVPTTIADHVRSAIIWAPSIVIFGGMGVAWGAWEAAGREPAQPGRKKSWFERNQGRVFMLIPVASIAVNVGGNGWLFFAFIFVWLEFVGPPIAKRLVLFPSPITNWLVVGVVPVLFALIGGFGFMQGDFLMRKKAPQWELLLKTDEGVETKSYLGMRRFGNATVLVSVDRMLFVVPSDMIQQARSLKDVSSSETLVCRWLGQNCLEKATPVPSMPASAAAAEHGGEKTSASAPR